MLATAMRVRKILLADDDEQMHELMQFVASKRGHCVLSVMAGREVARAAEAAQPDILVLDLGFPDADGRDLLQQLKADPKTAKIPVVVWSGRCGNPSDCRTTLELGAEDYVVKCDPALLLGKLERILLRIEQER